MNNNPLRFNTESALYEREIPFDGKDENGKDKVLYTAKISLNMADMEKFINLKLSRPISDDDVFKVLKLIFGETYEKMREIIKSISESELGENARLSQLMQLVFQDLSEFQKKTQRNTLSMINRQQRRAKK